MKKRDFLKSLLFTPVALQTAAKAKPSAIPSSKNVITLKFGIMRDGGEYMYLECSCGKISTPFAPIYGGYGESSAMTDLPEYKKFKSHICQSS